MFLSAGSGSIVHINDTHKLNHIASNYNTQFHPNETVYNYSKKVYSHVIYIHIIINSNTIDYLKNIIHVCMCSQNLINCRPFANLSNDLVLLLTGK